VVESASLGVEESAGVLCGAAARDCFCALNRSKEEGEVGHY
jgi:hypothetical protein